ncbi:hypothetical protein [Nocardia stercoris]|nr:hypothetical protein [Nocardia stercoris]
MDIISTGSAVLNMVNALVSIGQGISSLASGSASLSGSAPAHTH